ncbi:hypothetical protein GCM10023153_29550 [Ornithinibacter aureus]|uniref:Uncharacterized protein n=1 Tax=Ornithinibacter aureus TaxID=622664 RepID=A0ABP8K833_9MICO
MVTLELRDGTAQGERQSLPLHVVVLLTLTATATTTDAVAHGRDPANLARDPASGAPVISRPEICPGAGMMRR